MAPRDNWTDQPQAGTVAPMTSPTSSGARLLKAWMVREQFTQQALGAMLDVDASYISRLSAGTRSPSLALALRLERVTGGSVAALAWCDGASR